LTDAGEPVLYPGDLEKIKKRNNGRSRIFSIEFGKGANLRTDNFLKKLARDNGGSHAYRDVQDFRKKRARAGISLSLARQARWKAGTRRASHGFCWGSHW